jgi:hypothetical protein
MMSAMMTRPAGNCGAGLSFGAFDCKGLRFGDGFKVGLDVEQFGTRQSQLGAASGVTRRHAASASAAI